MAKPCQAPRSESRGSEKEAGWARIRKVKAKAQKLISMLCPKTWGQPSLIELSLYPIVRKKTVALPQLSVYESNFDFIPDISWRFQLDVCWYYTFGYIWHSYVFIINYRRIASKKKNDDSLIFPPLFIINCRISY